MRTLLLSLSLLAGLTAHAVDVMSLKGNKNIKDFGVAKRVLPRIYKSHEQTIYCGCTYEGKTIDLQSCDIPAPADPKSRFLKLEWEHVMPAARFGSIVPSWAAGDEGACGPGRRGRKCAAKASILFDQMEGDLYNLYPESGAINGARSNKEPAEVADGTKVRHFGDLCQTTTGRKTFAPRPSVRGEIARTYQYMSDAYDIPLSDAEKQQFQAWSAADPVDEWECQRAQRIKIEQGNANRFVEEACVIAAKKAAEEAARAAAEPKGL